MPNSRHKKTTFRWLLVRAVLMVPKAGLEPARISTVDFESTASTDFATSALQVVCGKRGHYTFQRSACNTYPLFNELSAEKIVAGVTFGWFYGRSMRRPDVQPSPIPLCAPPGATNKKGATQWLRLLKLPAVPLLAF